MYFRADVHVRADVRPCTRGCTEMYARMYRGVGLGKFVFASFNSCSNSILLCWRRPSARDTCRNRSARLVSFFPFLKGNLYVVTPHHIFIEDRISKYKTSSTNSTPASPRTVTPMKLQQQYKRAYPNQSNKARS